MDRSDGPTGIVPIFGEPWVKLANGSDFVGWSKDDEVAYNQINRQAQKLAFYVQAFDFLSDNGLNGDYHEYGCHRARTFRMALTEARRHNLDQMKFFAFDSFSGLPNPTSNPSSSQWKEGALHTSEEEFMRMIKGHGIYVDRCATIKGFYEKILTPELQYQFLNQQKRIAFACVDCDLYESAVPVFRFIEPLLQEGSVLYIDDYFTGYKGSPLRGAARAFHEFEKRTNFRFAPHMQIGWWGRSFVTYIE